MAGVVYMLTNRVTASTHHAADERAEETEQCRVKPWKLETDRSQNHRSIGDD
jgi:hypothetical protein